MSLSRPLVRTAIVGATVALTALGLSPLASADDLEGQFGSRDPQGSDGKLSSWVLGPTQHWMEVPRSYQVCRRGYLVHIHRES